MVFGFFSKERALQRTIKKATNKLSQSADRWAAMEKLRDIGTEEALYHLFRRFSFASLKLVDDEQEKAWVVQSMVAMGERCLPAMRRYMKSSSTIAYPLRILEDVADHDKALEIIDELLAVEEPGYTRDPTKRIQIIDWLAEWKQGSDEEVVERIVPYVADFDEGVRFAAVEAISLRPVPRAAEPLVKALINEKDESGRLKVRIAEVLADNKLDLCGHKKEVAPLLDDLLSDFGMQRDKLFRKKLPK
jgi:HEAT repeat protein